MCSSFGYVCVLLACILTHATALSRPPTMVLENNQYKNMVIAIHESIAEDKSLIDKLKVTMTEASQVLFDATLYRAYFKEITILIPSTWSDDPTYQALTSETVNMADVIITQTVRRKRSLPQARSYGGCGKQGVHIVLPLEFLTQPDAEPFSRYSDKYFVHAFAQFRWGVFQEYAEVGEPLYYFSLLTGRPEAIRCTLGIRGIVAKNDTQHTPCVRLIDSNTGLYTPDCLWSPYNSHQRIKASIMDHQWIAEIKTFCNDEANYATGHNNEAPSKHNRLCGHRSTWDVISNSEDFNNGKNQPMSNTTSSSAIVPNFKIVKAKARRRRAVIVVDENIPVNSNDLDRIINRIQHETNIHGLEVNRIMESEYGGYERTTRSRSSSNDQKIGHDDHIVYVKHSCENYDSDIPRSGAASLSVATTKDGTCNNETFDNHAVEGTLAGHTLYDRLREAVLKKHVLDNNFILIKREDVQLSAGGQFSDSVHLDSTVGQKTLFVFHYDIITPDIVLYSPSVVAYSEESHQYSVDLLANLVKFFFENAEAGEWKYVISSKDVTKQSISTVVSTTPRNVIHDPIVVKTFTEKSSSGTIVIHVDVTQGSSPVIGLNVTVQIETPSGNTETLLLYDNGAGADNTKSDGIYSRYFTKAKAAGYYHITAHVKGEEGDVYTMEESYFLSDAHNSDADALPLQRALTKRSIDGKIQRHVCLDSIHIPSSMVGATDINMMAEPNKDTTPPSRILDLKVIRHLHYRNTLVLTWTAPGDDLDHGTVQIYEIFIGESIKDVRALLWFSDSEYKGPGRIIQKKHTPVARAMDTETFLWTIPSDVTSFAFSVRGVDGAGNRGEMSNVVTFGFVEKPRGT